MFLISIRKVFPFYRNNLVEIELRTANSSTKVDFNCKLMDWFRSSHWRRSMFYKKSALKSFSKFTRKHLYQTLAQVFCCEFWKNLFSKEHLWLLLLHVLCVKGIALKLEHGSCFFGLFFHSLEIHSLFNVQSNHQNYSTGVYLLRVAIETLGQYFHTFS